MTSIDSNAVIDAIARLFPDGFDCYDRSDGWPETLLDDIGYDEPCAGFGELCRAIDRLSADGRLRDTAGGLRALSHTEQARRIINSLGLDNPWHGLENQIANVLAGKTEKTV